MGRVKDFYHDQICEAAEHDEGPGMEPPECSCRTPFAHSAMIDPPEPVLDRNCPIHGRDPDYELQKQRDDREIDF